VVNIRIRGIYSTALTRLMLDNGFQPVQPSATIDLNVYDRLDRQGVNAVGDAESVRAFAQILRATFSDVVVRDRFAMFAGTLGSEREPFFEVTSQVLRETGSSVTPRRVSLDFEFPGSSKKKLDSLRALVTPTLDGHHYYKACGGRISSLLEMAEKMLEKDCPRREVESLFKESIEHEFPRKGSRIRIEHVKINGKVFDLGIARITEFDKKNGTLKLLRTFLKRGIYDGLGIRKDPGDYAVTLMKLGEWSFRTRYFSRDGRYKGTYVNINTPIELYPMKIRYVDLEVDICLLPDGKIREVDRDKIEEKIFKGYISEKLGQIVNEKMKEILNSLSLDAEKNSSSR